MLRTAAVVRRSPVWLPIFIMYCPAQVSFLLPLPELDILLLVDISSRTPSIPCSIGHK